MIFKLARHLVSCRVVSKRLYSSPTKPFQMAGETVGVSLKTVLNALENFAPRLLSESWDNTGLLVEPFTSRDITKILLTNDLTEDVANEANNQGCEMIISYHPPIFAPLKSVTQKSWKERVVASLLERRIALYSPHTSWDAVQGGVNDWLASAFLAVESTPLVPGVVPNVGAGRLVESLLLCHFSLRISTTDPSLSTRRKVGSWDAVQGGVNDWLASAFPAVESTPLVPGVEPNVGAGRLVESLLLCHFSLRISTTDPSLSTRRKVGSWDAVQDGVNDWLASAFPAARSTPLVPGVEPNVGAGRLLRFKGPIPLSDAVARTKQLTGLPHVRLAVARGKTLEDPVASIALCAGSGASVLKGVDAELYLTGEMLHHDILDATQRGISVILTNHSDSERGFLNVFSEKLKGTLGNKVEVLVSKCDKDPLVTV